MKLASLAQGRRRHSFSEPLLCLSLVLIKVAVRSTPPDFPDALLRFVVACSKRVTSWTGASDGTGRDDQLDGSHIMKYRGSLS